jgi:hypothetical protein
MTAHHDLDRQLDALLLDGPTELPDPSFDAVRDRIEQTRQRVAIGPWRLPDMNKIVPLGLGAAAVVVALVAGTQLLGAPASGGVGGVPSATPPPTPTPTQAPPSPGGALGGTVSFQSDGAPATTVVDVVADGGSVSGTAVTTFGAGTHTVRLECAARSGDTWALGGTVEQSTVEAGSVGLWSAVVVKDGSPQRIGIWLSDDKTAGSDCDGWLAGIDIATIDPVNFSPVESGALVPPPDGAS